MTLGHIVVRTPSWGPQTFHRSAVTAHALQLDDAARCGIEPLTPEDFLAAIEEGRPLGLQGSGARVTYRVEPLGP